MYKMKRKQQATEYMILIMMAISVLVVTYLLTEFVLLFNDTYFF
ncbi:MAG: hypothetical protein RBR07_10540 [Arcobacteraceae bacterium]|nr:hypothetical protein [Arcobacteraceae bacterium]